MADMRLHRLLRQEQTLADLTVDEAVGDELQHLDLASRRLLLERANRRLERDHLGASASTPTSRNLVELARVRQITAEDLLALSSVHAPGIGAGRPSL